MKREENQTIEYKASWHDKYLEWICGYAERRGSGLGKIIDAYALSPANPRNVGPSFVSDTFFTVILPNLAYGLSTEELVAFATPNSHTPNSRTPNSRTPNSRPVGGRGLIRLLRALITERGSSELLALLGLKSKGDLYSRFLLPSLQQGLIEYTIPGKPNSRLQKYRLTAKGRDAIIRNRP